MARDPTPAPRLPTSGVHLQEWMARELTALSNEGTLLGYVRTALAFVAAGFAMVHFFKARSLIAIAGLWIAFGAGLASWGVHRFRQVRGVIRSHTALGDMRAGTP